MLYKITYLTFYILLDYIELYLILLLILSLITPFFKYLIALNLIVLTLIHNLNKLLTKL